MHIKAAIGQDSHRFEAAPDMPRAESLFLRNRYDAEDAGNNAATPNEPRADSPAPTTPAPCPLVLGGVEFAGEPPLAGNSDADVVLHALCNAISGITGVNILGKIADRMCLRDGITDSVEYVKEALKYLAGGRISHVSFSIECARPAINPRIMDMRERIANILGVDVGCVCITATSGEGLTDFGRGLGIQVLCILTAMYG